MAELILHHYDPDLHEIAVARESERAGSLVVHFPRDEYLLIETG